MSWATGIGVYVMLWWLALFVMLPIGVASQAEAQRSGWRGAPAVPALGKKALAATVIAAVLWVGVWWLISSPYLSVHRG